MTDTTNGSSPSVGTAGALAVTSGTATVSSGATSITLAGGAKNVTASTLSSGVVTGDIISVEVADPSKFTAQYDGETGLITIKPLATCSAVNMVVTANGRPGYTSPAPVTIAVTIT